MQLSHVKRCTHVSKLLILCTNYFYAWIDSRPRQEVRSSSEEEVDDHSEGYARRYGVPEVAFTSQEIVEETQLNYQYTMSGNETI